MSMFWLSGPSQANAKWFPSGEKLGVVCTPGYEVRGRKVRGVPRATGVRCDNQTATADTTTADARAGQRHDDLDSRGAAAAEMRLWHHASSSDLYAIIDGRRS
jgi:hypothetical protein